MIQILEHKSRAIDPIRGSACFVHLRKSRKLRKLMAGWPVRVEPEVATTAAPATSPPAPANLKRIVAASLGSITCRARLKDHRL